MGVMSPYTVCLPDSAGVHHAINPAIHSACSSRSPCLHLAIINPQHSEGHSDAILVPLLRHARLDGYDPRPPGLKLQRPRLQRRRVWAFRLLLLGVFDYCSQRHGHGGCWVGHSCCQTSALLLLVVVQCCRHHPLSRPRSGRAMGQQCAQRCMGGRTQAPAGGQQPAHSLLSHRSLRVARPRRGYKHLTQHYVYLLTRNATGLTACFAAYVQV